MILSDVAAERAVLAGVCKFNGDAYFDVADIVQDSTFTVDSNQFIWACIKKAFDEDEKTTIDIPTILSKASELGISEVFSKPHEFQHLKSVIEFPVYLSNVRKLAGKIRKLQVARLLGDQLSAAQDRISEITGEESVSHILGIAESSIFDFTALLNNDGDHPKKIWEDGIDEFVHHLKNRTPGVAGISTGYARYDDFLGGGLLPGVHVIGARTKAGKSILGLNIANHISKKLGLPLGYFDTEMTEEEHRPRLFGLECGLSVTDIIRNNITSNQWQAIENEIKRSKEAKVPFYFRSISTEIEETLPMMRRWLMRDIGFNTDGRAKPCAIIYDYLKLSTGSNISKNMAEFQVMGFQMTALHNFAKRYRVPILAFVQLNRDGIDSEGTDAISQSDRIGWLCSSFAIFKKKSEEEINQDGPENGNRKLKPIVSRFAEEWDEREYINMKFVGKTMKILECQTNYELHQEHKGNKATFETNIGNDDIPFSDD